MSKLEEYVRKNEEENFFEMTGFISYHLNFNEHIKLDAETIGEVVNYYRIYNKQKNENK